MDIGYFGYFDNEQQFSPTDFKECSKQIVNHYKTAKNAPIQNTTDNSEGEDFIIREFDKRLAPMGQKIRSKFQSQKEVKLYLCKKYFNQEDVPKSIKHNNPKTYAMFENDYNAICYGTVGSANLQDPRLYFNSDEWTEYTKDTKLDDIMNLNAQMQALIETDNLKINENDTVLISFNPYTYQADIKSDIDSKTIQALKHAINIGGNSKELFFYAYQNSPSRNSSSITKMRAYHSVYDFSGYKLSDLIQKNGSFYTETGENIIDVIAKNIKENELVPSDFQEDVLDNLQDSLDSIAQKGYSNIPDLSLNVIYSKKDGFLMTGGNYSV